MSKTKTQDALRAAGIDQEHHWLIHSSFRSVQSEFATPLDAVVNLAAAIYPSVAMFPTFTGDKSDGPGRPPSFNSRTSTPYTGAIPSAAVQHMKVISGRRSLHPTHSVVATGRKNVSFTASHYESITPCGEDSPFDRLIRIGNGRILLLGVGLDRCTLFHAVEERAKITYVCQPELTLCELTDEEGTKLKPRLLSLHSWETKRCYPNFEDELMKLKVVEEREVLGARSLVVDVSRFVDWGLDRLGRDPNAFVST